MSEMDRLRRFEALKDGVQRLAAIVKVQAEAIDAVIDDVDDDSKGVLRAAQQDVDAQLASAEDMLKLVLEGQHD